LVCRTVGPSPGHLLLAALIGGAASIGLFGCGKTADDLFCAHAGCAWTKEEWARIATLSPLPPPPHDDSNRVVDDPAAVAFGQELYFDARFSGNATLVDSIGEPVPYARAPAGQPIEVACASCHDPKRGGADFTSAPNTVSIGAGWYDVNSQQTVNVAQYPLLYWNGRTDSIWAQAAAVAESGVSVNGTRLGIFWALVNDPHYHAEYNALFIPYDATFALPDAPSATEFPSAGKPGQPAFDGMSEDDRLLVTRVLVNWAKAIAAYETSLVSRDSPFDRWVADGPDSTWISPAAQRGARLFVGKASCIDCHNGPMFSDMSFHDVAVPQVGDHVPTVRDCPTGNAKCDCTPGDEKTTCLPAGAWAGLGRLAASVDKGTTVNFNNFRRDSRWSDNTTPDPAVAARYTAPTDVTLKGAWRTPSLRDVALTAPYMHDGAYATLEDVVWHYNAGGTASASTDFQLPICGAGGAATVVDGGACMDAGAPAPGKAIELKPLGLADDEVADLVEFLKTLTGAPLDPAMTSKPAQPPADAGSAPDGGADANGGQ
jgi:cytochrome c peroxidase